jgi:hypothetical protein
MLLLALCSKSKGAAVVVLVAAVWVVVFSEIRSLFIILVLTLWRIIYFPQTTLGGKFVIIAQA